MGKSEGKLITIELRGEQIEDGRFYFSSPDLDGFHYLLEENETHDDLVEPLSDFLQLYLHAKIKKMMVAQNPRTYRATHRAQSSSTRIPARDYSYIAEVQQKEFA